MIWRLEESASCDCSALTRSVIQKWRDCQGIQGAFREIAKAASSALSRRAIAAPALVFGVRIIWPRTPKRLKRN